MSAQTAPATAGWAVQREKSMLALADSLDRAERKGADTDEPEGVRYIQFSDTLARQIAADLRRFAS